MSTETKKGLSIGGKILFNNEIHFAKMCFRAISLHGRFFYSELIIPSLLKIMQIKLNPFDDSPIIMTQDTNT